MRSPYSALRSRAIGSTPIGTPRVPLRSDRYTLPHLGSSRLGLRGMHLPHRRHYRQECNTSCPATFAGSSAAKSPIPLVQPPAPVSSDQPSSAIHTHAHHGLPAEHTRKFNLRHQKSIWQFKLMGASLTITIAVRVHGYSRVTSHHQQRLSDTESKTRGGRHALETI